MRRATKSAERIVTSEMAGCDKRIWSMVRGDSQVSKSNCEDEGGNRTGREGGRWREGERGNVQASGFPITYKRTSPFTT